MSSYSLNETVKIYAKAEYLNPSCSIKDRIAVNMITNAEKTGQLRPGMTVVAATSGNTGSAVAMACAQVMGNDVAASFIEYLVVGGGGARVLYTTRFL